MSLLNNPAFTKVQQTESTFTNAHLYLNYTEFSKLLNQNTKLNKKLKNNKLDAGQNGQELDLKTKDNNLMFSGFTLAQDSSNNFLNTLSEQQPQTILMDAILPSNTQKMGVLGINDFRSFYAKYTDFLAKHNNLYEHNKWIQQRDKDYGINLENTFAAIIEMNLAISTFASTGNSDNYVIIQAESEAVEILRHLNKNITENPYNDTHRGIELFKLHIPNVLQGYLEICLAMFMKNYFCWIDGYLVFANSPTALKTFINSNLSRKTLTHNIYYQNYTKKHFI